MAATSAEEEYLSLDDYRPLLERLVRLLRSALGERLLSVCVYGSIARGRAQLESDVDLIVVVRGEQSDANEGWRCAVDALRESHEYQALRERGLWPDLSPFIMTEDYLREQTPWLFLEVQDHGVILFDVADVFAEKLDAVRRRMRELGSKKVILSDGSWYWDVKPDWKPREVFEL